MSGSAVRLVGDPRSVSDLSGLAGLACEGARGVELRERAEERAEEAERGVDVRHAHSLAYGVHAQRRDPEVDDAQPRLGGDDGADRHAARAVVLHHELLHGEAGTPRQLAHHEATLRVRGVALVVVGLDHDAAVELGRVRRAVLLRVVRVHRVRRVRGQKEAPARRHKLCLSRCVRRVRCEAGGDALQRLAHDWAGRARQRLGAALLVIEERDHAHVARSGRRRGRTIDERTQGSEAMDLVVEARRGEELVREPPHLRGLRVEEREVEVHDVARRAAQLGAQQREQLGGVPPLEGHVCRRRRAWRGRGGVGRCVGGRLVHGLRHHGEDGLQVRLLVDRELGALVGRLQVDAQVGDAQQRPAHADELLVEGAARLAHDDLARDRELPVEPRVPQPTSVRLDVDLLVPLAAPL
mmetsp:Transcript_36606/g.92788  ORF Transcript_36606/g.92788 Transcript_36606/m.92788 type:complete len:411 (-) Transcript_36606:363-1595(-)